MKKLFILMLLSIVTVQIYAQHENLCETATYATGNGSTALGNNWWTSTQADAWVSYTWENDVTFDEVCIAFRDVVSNAFTISWGESSEDENMKSKDFTIEESEGDNLKNSIDGANASNYYNALLADDGTTVTAKYVKIQLTSTFNNASFTLSYVKIYNTTDHNLYVHEELDDWGFVTVVGELSDNNKSVLESSDYANALGFDLRQVELNGLTQKINPANPNALFYFADSATAIPDEATLDEIQKTNVVYLFQAWLRASTPIVIVDVDDNFHPFYTSHQLTDSQHCHLDTQNEGYTYTRTVAAKRWVTICPPNNYIGTLPDGIIVYDIDTYEDGTIGFKEVNDVIAYTPYVVLNPTDNPIDLTFTGTGNFFSTGSEKTTTLNGVSLVGSVTEITSDGSQYGFQNSSFTGSYVAQLKQLNGAIIGASRAYFTFDDGIEPSSISLRFNEGTTGIDALSSAILGEGDIYTLGGVKVTEKNLNKGVYIKNGKKIIIK